MLQPMGGLPYATNVNSLSSTQSPAQSQTTSSSDFANQLATAIQGVLQQSGNGTQYEIDIKTGQGVDGKGFTITVTDDSDSSGSFASSASGSSASGSSSQSVPPSPSSSGSSTSSGASSSSVTPADAYWAEQPATVQALRYMKMDERGGYAEMLAAEGYTIDVPIMVDGEDPLAVMIQREIDGYTWVPSALQANIPAGPGIEIPGAAAYDPNHPPPGSIKVTTAFALGTNLQDPVVSQQDMQTYVLGQAAGSSSS